jgi:hypothetical protein
MGWNLLKCFCASFPCTPRFEPYLRKFLRFHSVDSSMQFHHDARICETHHEIVKKRGARKYALTAEEVTTMETRQPFLFPVFCPDNTLKRMDITPCTTGSEVVSRMASKLGLVEDGGNADEWGLFIVNKQGLETWAKSGEYIMDQLCAAAEKKQSLQFVFKRALWIDDDLPVDPVPVSFLYHQVRKVSLFLFFFF